MLGCWRAGGCFRGGDSGIGLEIRRPLGINFPIGCFGKARGRQVAFKKGKNRPKSHRVESLNSGSESSISTRSNKNRIVPTK